MSGALSGWLTFHSALAGNRLLQGSQGFVMCLQCEGVGKDSIPGAINFDIINDMIQVTDKQSFLVSLPTLHLS